MNLAAAYLKLNHFQEALCAINDGLSLSEKNSILLFRKSQAFSCNQDATAEELDIALKEISKAIELKKFEEKIPEKNGPDVPTISLYYDQLNFVEKRIRMKKEEEKKIVSGWFCFNIFFFFFFCS